MKTRQSQNARLLAWLKSKRSIAPLRALYTLGIYRLAARIADLRALGHNIKSEMVYEHPVKFCRYTLKK